MEIRRLVEGEGVDVLVGSNFPSIGRAFVEYASLQPDVTFLIPEGEQLSHLAPGPNVFRFSPTSPSRTPGWGRTRTASSAGGAP